MGALYLCDAVEFENERGGVYPSLSALTGVKDAKCCRCINPPQQACIAVDILLHTDDISIG